MSLLQDPQGCGHIHDINVAKSAPSISYLLFADDTFFMGHAMVEEATRLKFAISFYERVLARLVITTKVGLCSAPTLILMSSLIFCTS